MATRYRFPKQKRIVSSRAISLVLRRGQCVADDCLVLFALPLGDDVPESVKLGVTIPKKTGGAVTRNRWKRLIRESFRTQQDVIPHGFQYVVRPKKGARPNWASIQRSLPKLAQRARKRLIRSR